jgi:riboflavin kinase / FMN adenylyltransferase
MKTITNVEQLKNLQLAPCVVALGTFDGVHLGHCDVVNTAKNYAVSHSLKLMVFTFSNHPLSEIRGSLVPPLLLDNTTKEKIFADLGVDILLNIPFTEELSQLSGQKFLEFLSINNVKAVVVGANYSYGYMGRGDVYSLQTDGPKFGFDVLVRKLIKINGTVVSSTNIRKFIRDGRIELATAMLGRAYTIVGTVVHGDERGRVIGFPTANINLVKSKFVLPSNGVYGGKVIAQGKTYIALLNVGSNPTFGDKGLKLEAHLLNFKGDLYGEEIVVEFYYRIRGEIKFPNVEELTEQIKLDKEEIEGLF